MAFGSDRSRFTGIINNKSPSYQFKADEEFIGLSQVIYLVYLIIQIMNSLANVLLKTKILVLS